MPALKEEAEPVVSTISLDQNSATEEPGGGKVTNATKEATKQLSYESSAQGCMKLIKVRGAGSKI